REQDREGEEREDHDKKADEDGDIRGSTAGGSATDDGHHDRQDEKRRAAELDQPRLARLGRRDPPSAALRRPRDPPIDARPRRTRVAEGKASRPRISAKNRRPAEPALVDGEKERRRGLACAGFCGVELRVLHRSSFFWEATLGACA